MGLLTPYNLIVLIFYGVGTLLSLGDRRALGWLSCGASVFLVSVLLHRAGLPHAEVTAGILDFLIISAMYRWALYRWELVVWIMFEAMLVLNFALSLGVVPAYEQTVALELLNIVAALTTGAASVMRREGYVDNWFLDPWRTVFGRVRHVYRQG